MYDFCISLNKSFKIWYYRDYYDGWLNALWLGFIVIEWKDIGRKSDVW